MAEDLVSKCLFGNIWDLSSLLKGEPVKGLLVFFIRDNNDEPTIQAITTPKSVLFRASVTACVQRCRASFFS